jgi:hypothetical protein
LVIVSIGTPISAARVDLVIDVSVVAQVGDARKAPPQQPHQHVKHHRRPGIAEVGIIINRRPADIDRHMAGISRTKALPLAAERVVKDEFAHQPSRVPRRRLTAQRQAAGTNR